MALPEPHTGAEDPDVPGWCAAPTCGLPMRHPVHTAAPAPARPAAAQPDPTYEAALDHASPEWKARAVQVIRQLADSGKTFTSETVTDIVGLPAGHQSDNGNNSVGNLIAHARRKGVIAWAGRTDKSKHGSDIKVWVGSAYAHLYVRPDYHRGETA